VSADRRNNLARVSPGCDDDMPCGERALCDIKTQAAACASNEPNLLVSHVLLSR
jgi:hypothetical protein